MEDSQTRSRALRATLLAAVLLPGSASAAASQTAIILADENFRTAPQGTRLGFVPEGTAVEAGRTEDGWVEVTLEGWMWIRSIQRTDRRGFDLVVSAGEGENLREVPSGKILARLVEGTLLNEVERSEGWAKVRRTGWMWGASVEVARAEPEPPPPTRGPDLFVTGGPGGAAILTGPDGDTLARTEPNTEVSVLGREGNWARVRIDGWMWSPGVADAPLDDTVSMAELTPGDVAEAPDRYRGRIVSWELQYISVERAERVRTDFFEGEPFLLTRPADGAGGFVYVAVAPERLSSVSGLTPLERITVVGRIRTGAATLTGNPIVDLLELHRGGQ